MRFPSLINLSLFLLVITSFPTLAADCFSDSPSKKNGTLDNAETKTTSLKKSQIKNIRNLFKDFKGHWKGEAEYVYCQGDKGSPKASHVGSILDGNIEVKGDSLRIDIDLKANSTNKTSSKKLNIFLASNLLRHDDKNKQGDVNIVSIEKNKIYYVKKHRATSGNSNFLEEITVILRKIRSEYVLEQRYYVNGAMDSKEIWIFKK